MKQIVFILSILISCANLSFAQNDPVLFTVDKVPVHVSEFKYIYEKTNGDKATYSKASVEEYLELYKKFKLKVKKAKEMRLDTISSLKTELDGYRKQLANSYLIDKEVTEALIKEAYERSKKDVDISHIMIALKPNALPADTLTAYNKVVDIKARLDKGEKFELLAQSKSEDQVSRSTGGRIGFVTSMLPDGFYNLETAAYTTAKGKYSDPIRTGAGYHIVKVNDIRDARAEMEAAHILLRKAKKGEKSKNAKARIDSIYQALQAGADFETLATKLSNDKVSAAKGGNIGVFGINRYERPFEDAAFALAKNGDYTKPVETSVGWHIIKRIERQDALEYKVARARLQSKIKRDSRYKIATKAMIERIKIENNFIQSDKTIDRYIRNLDDTFLSYKWKAQKEVTKQVLFTLGDEPYSQVDFETYIESASRKRMRLGRSGDIASTARTLYADYVEDRVLAYEERQLEVKYPEFKSLIREYEEGILLFEATKILVWDKAAQDSIGLANYFEKLKGKGKYMWKDRAKVSFYSIKAEEGKQLDKIRQLSKEKATDKVLEKVNKKSEVLTVRYETIEKGKNKVLDALRWAPNVLSEVEISKRNQSLNFMKIEEIIAPAPKTLKEARGYIVADYQDYLEKNWIQELEQAYKIKVNQKTLRKLIK